MDTDVLSYFPIADGVKNSTPAFKFLPAHENPEQNKIFQIDEFYDETLESKWAARKERLSKYYQRISPLDQSFKPVVKYIIDTLAKEHPDVFGIDEFGEGRLRLRNKHTFEHLFFNNYEFVDNGLYVDALDALGMQVQEDLVIHQLQPLDRAVAIHLFNPNGWSAEGWIGQSFEQIHRDVKDVDDKLIIPNPEKFAQRLLNLKSPIERVGAISFRPDCDFNRHPEAPPVKPFGPDNLKLYMRFERQTVTPFPEQGFFLFTIKTLLTNCDHPDEEKRSKILRALKQDTSKIYSREFLNEHKALILRWLGESV